MQIIGQISDTLVLLFISGEMVVMVIAPRGIDLRSILVVYPDFDLSCMKTGPIAGSPGSSPSFIRVPDAVIPSSRRSRRKSEVRYESGSRVFPYI